MSEGEEELPLHASFHGLAPVPRSLRDALLLAGDWSVAAVRFLGDIVAGGDASSAALGSFAAIQGVPAEDAGKVMKALEKVFDGAGRRAVDAAGLEQDLVAFGMAPEKAEAVALAWGGVVEKQVQVRARRAMEVTAPRRLLNWSWTIGQTVSSSDEERIRRAYISMSLVTAQGTSRINMAPQQFSEFVDALKSARQAVAAAAAAAGGSGDQ
jgi:hypothetical protein